MEFINKIKQLLAMNFKPSKGVMSREELREAFDPTWELLITQARVTTEVSRQCEDWYTLAVPTTYRLPELAVEEAVREKSIAREVAAKCPPEDPVPESLQGPQPVPLDKSPERSSQDAEREALDEIWGLPTPEPHPLPRYFERRYQALARTCQKDYTNWQIIPYTGGPRVLGEEDVLPMATGVIPLPPPPPKASVVGAILGLSTRFTKVAGEVKGRLSAPPREPSPTCIGLEQVAGEPMGYMNAHSVAMELRARYGVQPATAANLQLGNRVAREILEKQCGATRDMVFILGHLATTLWFTPTMVDLALQCGPKDFLLGDVVARRGVETKVKTKIHPKIRVLRAARPRPVERVSYQIDVVRPCADFGVHNNSLNNLVRGVNERVFYTDHKRKEPRRPSAGSFDKIDISEIKAFRVQPWTLGEVVDSYTGSQRVRYGQAVESLAVTPLSRNDARVKTFVKAEKINFTAKPDPAPRVIQPRDPRFNACFAKYTKPLEPLLYKQLGKLYQFPCIAKGFNAVETGEIVAKKWKCFSDPVCVGLDASRFDQHVSCDALRFTHSVYKRFVKGREVNKLLSWMYKNHALGSAKDGFVKYEVEGCRMSGDMDTALGNCVLMVLMTRQLCKNLSIPHELMNNGDDCIVIFDRQYLSTFQDAVEPWFKELGFTMKVEEPVYHLERVDFCQTRPVYDGKKWRMVRHISSIAKDCCSVIDWEQLPAWWNAIGECGIAVAGGIPIHNSFLRWLLRSGESNPDLLKHGAWKNEGLAWYRMGMDLSHERHVSDEARASFHTAFGIEPSMQVALEQIYDSLPAPTIGGKRARVCKPGEMVLVDSLPPRHFNDYFQDVGIGGSSSDYVVPGTHEFEPGTLWTQC
uniref:RNA-directed RNA polymerase n=1 Tax=Tobacco bushy top virus TaxID=184020 RepID=A0A0K6S5N7_9TOMB|nr:RNA-dependent RNA polymerase [Tobacco bushy top virus]